MISRWGINEDKTTVEIYDEEELSKAVFDTIKWYKDEAAKYAKRNKELYDNAAKVANDDLKKEIERLKERLSMSYGEFSSQKEKDAYEDFAKRHMHERLTSKIQGGKAPYLIPTGVGIGIHLEVVCPICGEREDITDTEVW